MLQILSVSEELGFDTTKTNLVIGGASSGAHLAMLYSYSRGDRAALPIKLIIDAVGPVDIKPDCWKQFNNASEEVLSAGITNSAIQTQKTNGNISDLPIMGEGGATWNDYQTMRIANGEDSFNSFHLEKRIRQVKVVQAWSVGPNGQDDGGIESFTDDKDDPCARIRLE